MCDDIMELNDTELNYIYFETDSDDVSYNLDEDFMFYFIFYLFPFKQFSIVQTLQGFSIRGILYGKTLCISK